MQALNPGQIAEAIELCVKAKENVCIWGPPGIGKSSIVEQVSDRLFAVHWGYEVRDGIVFDKNGLPFADRPWLTDIRVSQLDPVDLRGLPWIKDGVALWAIPGFLPRGDKPGIILWDELNRGMPSVQNACLQPLGPSRRLGDYKVPDNISQVVCCNPASTSKGVYNMVDALAGRMLHLEIKADADHKDWLKWAAANGMPAELMAFAMWRPESIYAHEPGKLACPTYRNWARVGKILLAGIPQALERAMIEGCVGEGVSTEAIAFFELFRKMQAMSIPAIMSDPNGHPVPDDDQHGTRYAIAAALSRRMDVTNIGRCLTYLDRLPGEYATFALTSAIKRDPKLTNTQEYVQRQVTHNLF